MPLQTCVAAEHADYNPTLALIEHVYTGSDGLPCSRGASFPHKGNSLCYLDDHDTPLRWRGCTISSSHGSMHHRDYRNCHLRPSLRDVAAMLHNNHAYSCDCCALQTHHAWACHRKLHSCCSLLHTDQHFPTCDRSSSSLASDNHNYHTESCLQNHDCWN